MFRFKIKYRTLNDHKNLKSRFMTPNWLHSRKLFVELNFHFSIFWLQQLFQKKQFDSLNEDSIVLCKSSVFITLLKYFLTWFYLEEILRGSYKSKSWNCYDVFLNDSNADIISNKPIRFQIKWFIHFVLYWNLVGWW